MNEISEADMLEAIRYAHEAIKKQCAVQLELMKEAGTEVKREYSHEQNDEELKKLVSINPMVKFLTLLQLVFQNMKDIMPWIF